MRFAWTRLLYVALAMLAGCGNKSLLGVKNAFEVSMTADNQSDYLLQVMLSLSQAATNDGCEKSDEKKTIAVPAKSTKDDSLTLKCENPPRNSVSLSLKSPADPTKPLQWASLSLDDAKLKGTLAGGTEVRWRVDQTTLRVGMISSFDWLDVDGVKTPGAEPTRVSVPNVDALIAAPVRAQPKKVQVYFAPDTTVVDIGLAATLFDAKPDGAAELDGFYYFLPRIETFGGTLAMTRPVATGKVTCDNTTCAIELP